MHKLKLALLLMAASLLAAQASAQQQQKPAVPQPKPAAQPVSKPAATVQTPQKPQPQAQQKPRVAQKPPAQKPQTVARRGPPRGPIEKFDCKVGSEDQHARIAVMAQGGEVQSVAYYSKWKPRTCSIHLQRGDAYSRWNDTGDTTVVNTEHGDFLIKASRAQYQFIFRDIDRMHYCGMLGKLNGSMTLTRGPRRQCSVEGVMDRNEPEPEPTEAEQKPDSAIPDQRADSTAEPKSEQRAEAR